MQRTKLGISVGLLGAGAYFCGLLGWYVPLVLIAGYVLLVEENQWLRKTSVKAVIVTMFFALLSVLIGLIPDCISTVSSVFGIFGGSFSIGFLTKLVAALQNILSLIRIVVLAIMGFKALTQGNIAFSPADKLSDKHM